VIHVSDRAVDRLRGLDDRPDFAGTRYDLLEPLGRGGMGTVFRGRDRALDRDVAIKVTTWATGADADRLRREARTLAALEHPGIVPIHDVGVLGDGRVFTVMMLVRGRRLDAAVDGVPLRDRLRVFDRICDTVSFAHAGGVVHRDLKPANVMVGPFGRVFVLDWGLADPGAECDRGGDGVSTACGTDGYRAPEQSTHNVDPRLDVYALGAILRDLAADDPSPIPRPLESVIGRAMGSDPGSRYATVEDLAMDVRRFLDGAAVLAHREAPLERTARLARTYRMPLALVLAYLAIRVLFVVLSR